MIALGIESSNSRGMGHLFRSLLYVEYFKSHNIDFVYLINDDNKSIMVLKQKNIQYEIVNYSDESSCWERTIIEKYNVNIWLNDKFETSKNFAKHIKDSGIFLALIDDIGEGEVYADIHFAGLISFSKKNFKSLNTISGMEYVILNDEIEKYKRVRECVNSIIVSFGGSDPYSNTLAVVKELMRYDYKFDVTIGPNSTCQFELEKMNDGRFRILKNVPSLIELFSHYDFAITGGGVTCCESNAAGIPCIIIANAAHEINTGICMQSFGGCVYAGDYLEWDKDIIKSISDMDIKEMSRKGMSVFKTDAIDKIFSLIFEKYEKMKG